MTPCISEGEEKMKTRTGATAESEKLVEISERSSRASGKTVEIGPFRSIEEAEQWLQFMSRGETGVRVYPPLQASDDGLWYCFMIDTGR